VDCCVSGKQDALDAGYSRSDSEGELSKGRGKAVSKVDINAKFVVAPAQVLGECVSGADDAGRVELFRPRIGHSQAGSPMSRWCAPLWPPRPAAGTYLAA
jgi:hypothetical protein